MPKVPHDRPGRRQSEGQTVHRKRLARKTRSGDIFWASTPEVFNVLESEEMDCHIITAPPGSLKKLSSIGNKPAAELSMAAVHAFHDDMLAPDLRLGGAAVLDCRMGR